LCVEESVHVLFDETNSLVEIDAQDNDFELGLAKKICCPHLRKVSIPRMDQSLELLLWKVNKV